MPVSLRGRIFRILAVVAVCVALVLLYIYNPSHASMAPKCPFKTLTGLSCGGCGGQRAVHAMLHGQWRVALGFNLYLVYALPYFLLLIVNRYYLPRTRLTLRVSALLESRPAVYLYIVSYILWMIVRNILNI